MLHAQSPGQGQVQGKRLVKKYTNNRMNDDLSSRLSNCRILQFLGPVCADSEGKQVGENWKLGK